MPFKLFAPSAPAAAAPEALGALPEWDLSALYSGMDSPAFAADMARAQTECSGFAARWRGKLAGAAKASDPAGTLAEAVRAYEALEDLLGRLMSYAGLVYSGDTTDPVRAKFYGDTQEKLTTMSAELLFFTLELNRIDDAVINQAAAHAPLARYRPWLEDVRREKPYQLDDELERLFLEKSVTGRSAWNRLFDETIARSLRSNRRSISFRMRRKRNESRRRTLWRRHSARICASSRSSPTRWRRTRTSPTAGAGFRTSPIRAISRTASSARSSTRWSAPFRRPIRACRIAIIASRRNGSARTR